MTLLVGRDGTGWTTADVFLGSNSGKAIWETAGFTPVASGTATTAYVYIADFGLASNAKVIVYRSSDGVKLAESADMSGAAGLKSAAINVAISTGTPVKLAVVPDAGYLMLRTDSLGSGYALGEVSMTYATVTDPLPASTGDPGGANAKPFIIYLDGSSDTAKASATTEVPKVTIGPVTDVDLDTTFGVVPKATLASVVGRSIASTFSVVPKATMGAGQVFSSSISRSQSQSLIPKATLASRLAKTIPHAQSLVPVVTMANSVSTGNVGKTSAFSLIPQATLASAVNNVNQSKSASLSLIPVATVADQVNRINAAAEPQSQPTLTPNVTLTVAREISGDVDRISIVSRPIGTIEIKAA